MARTIKRYGSRKLYDTEDSRYVSLEEIAQWIRNGEEVQVIDNKTGEDVTVHTLTQVISDEGRRGRSFLGTAFLHDVIRLGETAVTTGVKHLQDGVNIVKKSISREEPPLSLQEEMDLLRQRLEEMQAAIDAFEKPNDENTTDEN